MDQRAQTFHLIGNRLSAVIAVCLTGFLAERDFRGVFSAATPKSTWLINLDFLSLPLWTTAAVSLAFSVYLLWVGFWFYRGVQGKERIVVGGFFTSGALGLLGPISGHFSLHAGAAIRFVQGIGMAVACFGAVLILVKSPAFGKSDAMTAGRTLLLFAGFVGFALMIGALIYFAPWR